MLLVGLRVLNMAEELERIILLGDYMLVGVESDAFQSLLGAFVSKEY